VNYPKVNGISLSPVTEEGLLLLTFDRPKKYNSLTIEIFEGIPEIFQKAAEDPSVKITALTGNGLYYSSGANLDEIPKDVHIKSVAEKMAEDFEKMTMNFIDAFLDFPKPLVALVNGPAVGIAVTTLVLCDTVWASELATFSTPFVATAQGPEGCSSFLFPRYK